MRTSRRAVVALLTAAALTGCAGPNDGEGGGFLAGLRPAKPSRPYPSYLVVPMNPAVDGLFHPDVDLRGPHAELPPAGDVAQEPIRRVNSRVDLERPLGDILNRDGIVAETVRIPFPIEHLDDIVNAVVLRSAADPSDLVVVDEAGDVVCHLWLDIDGELAVTDCH